jgi:nucleotide-binding universal stress UspA family protein
MKYLIPYDFTPITRSALDHAISLSNAIPGHLELLHIIGSEKERSEAEAKLDAVKAEFPGADIDFKVRVGSIFNDIAKEAEESDAGLLVMGTHGAKGLQKVLGSHAIKVITSANTPFIITQKAGPKGGIKNIVLPVDLSLERLQVVDFAASLAKDLGAKVHLVCKSQTDEWLLKKLKTNISRAKSNLADNDIDHEVHELSGKKSFQNEVIEYGEKVGADLFAIAYYPETILPQFETFAQDMITNRLEVPVLVVKAREIMSVNSKYAFIAV